MKHHTQKWNTISVDKVFFSSKTCFWNSNFSTVKCPRFESDIAVVPGWNRSGLMEAKSPDLASEKPLQKVSNLF